MPPAIDRQSSNRLPILLGIIADSLRRWQVIQFPSW